MKIALSGALSNRNQSCSLEAGNRIACGTAALQGRLLTRKKQLDASRIGCGEECL
jgi:hypothetical protein